MNSIYALAPLSLVVLASLIVLLLDVFLKRENKSYLGFLSILSLLGLGTLCVLFWNKGYGYFKGSLQLDNLALFFIIILAIATLLIILISLKYISLHNTNFGEYYALLLLAFSGMIIMVSSSNLLVIFLGLEVLSMSSYALAGLKSGDHRSAEAALKYFLLGSFASAFLVYGLALLFGAFHTLDIPGLVGRFGEASGNSLMALIGLGLLIIGFGFKIAVVPFHMWTPDVYEGAHTHHGLFQRRSQSGRLRRPDADFLSLLEGRPGFRNRVNNRGNAA